MLKTCVLIPWPENPLIPSQTPAALEDTSSNLFQCYTPPLVKIMPSSFNRWLDLTLPNTLHLIGIFVIALGLNRLLRAVTNLVIKQASGQGRPAQLREQQTRTLAAVLYSAGSQIFLVASPVTAPAAFNLGIPPAAT